MRIEDLDFELPTELIAQFPAADRASSRLLHYRGADRSIAHRQFSALPSLLRPGDLMVFNDARVIPARFMLRKESGGLVEGLFLGQKLPGKWQALLKNAGAGWAKTKFHLAEAPSIAVKIVEKGNDGEFTLVVESNEPATVLLERIGRMPLPPYIKRDKGHDPRDEDDRERYQTIYGRNEGSVAAPTAGLHFTEPVLDELSSRGIERAFVTLHVGLGTFKPIAASTLSKHEMHSEGYSISAETAELLNRAKANHRRIIAVGTTAARVLESQRQDHAFTACQGETSIFIYPPYSWKHVGALITNFHLPRSTLIALVAARIGLDEQRRLYAEAIAQGYRFFSYGDAMLIE